jgi:hypothetical protein
VANLLIRPVPEKYHEPPGGTADALAGGPDGPGGPDKVASTERSTNV